MNGLDLIRKELEQTGQTHLLKFWPELNEEQRDKLQQELKCVNFKEVTGFFHTVMESLNDNGEKLDHRMKPIPKSQYGSVDTSSTEMLKAYFSTGLEKIAAGELGILLMAGGQGTRLGSKNPKGMFPIGIPSKKTLLQIQAERIIRLQHLSKERFGKNKPITWYIMTSESTMTATEKFLIENKYFGLEKENIVIFEQGHLPCFDFDGRIILDEKYHISLAPDGNGGIYRALQDADVFKDIDRRGVKYLHVYGVDNILVKVGDPTFVGYCIDKDADCGAKVVQKNHPHEAVGVVCQVDDIYQVCMVVGINNVFVNK